MKPWIKKTGLWLLISGLTGFIASQIMIYTIPYVIMGMASDKLFAALGTNRIIHAPKVTHKSRQVVRPSPDLSYSICGFDLSDGPLEITTPDSNGNYWSVSAYGSNTDNFWVMNDRQRDKSGTVLLGTEKQLADLDPQVTGKRVPAPSETGVILFRHLVALPEDFARVNRIRRQGNCQPY